MDNITHTMVGAALGQAGLRRLTGLGTATLMITANIPDVDVLAAFWTDSLAFRRGWTHGPLGLLVLPAIVAGGMIAFDRLQGRWGLRPDARGPVSWWPLLLLAYIGALTHPFLDWLNTYGIRLLMPFSHEWFYGDALFIIDPWVWLALGIALFVGRRRRKRSRARPERPALIALLFVTVYITLMIGGSRVASEVVEREIIERGQGPVEQLMAGPVPANPFKRDFIYDRGDEYGFGMLTFRPSPDVRIDDFRIPKQFGHPAVVAVIDERPIQNFLYWSRFPFFDVDEQEGAQRVTVFDARFARGARGGWASRSVIVERREM